jgi:glutathione S-transferase
MIELLYYPSTASMAPHILLEELGTPYRRVLVDRTKDEHKLPGYLKLNPNGLIPVLFDGDLVLYETAAICLHLCDTHPQAQLAPPLGSHERAHFYKWLMWLTNTLQATLIVYFYPDRWVNAGDQAAAAQVKHHAQNKVAALLRRLDALLSSHGQDWLLGEHYSALDAYAMMLCRWTRNFSSDRARDMPHIGPYLQRVLARPAVQRVFAAEGLSQPWV